jgi:hypothetical protein
VAVPVATAGAASVDAAEDDEDEAVSVDASEDDIEDDEDLVEPSELSLFLLLEQAASIRVASKRELEIGRMKYPFERVARWLTRIARGRQHALAVGVEHFTPPSQSPATIVYRAKDFPTMNVT